MRVLIATGGTGGHIYPALALADAMKEKDPQTEILFVGTAERMESTEIPKAGYAFEAIKAKGLNGSAWRRFRPSCSWLRRISPAGRLCGSSVRITRSALATISARR